MYEQKGKKKKEKKRKRKEEALGRMKERERNSIFKNKIEKKTIKNVKFICFCVVQMVLSSPNGLTNSKRADQFRDQRQIGFLP